MFRIDKIKGVDRQKIDVSLDGKYTEKNYFSIITGENGCGKSSLLNRAVNNFVFRQADFLPDCQLTGNSITTPSRVIAICNARYSKFPKMIHVLRKNDYKPHNFYIHAEHDTEVGRSLISILGNILRENPSKGKFYNKIGVSKALKMIGVNPTFLIDVRLNSNLVESYRRHEESELGLIEDSKISTSDNVKN